jgi:hypothetical protein
MLISDRQAARKQQDSQQETAIDGVRRHSDLRRRSFGTRPTHGARAVATFGTRRARDWQTVSVTDPPAGGRLTNAELANLAALLARFASYDLDQFEHWRFETPYGAAYLTLAMKPLPETSDEQYTTIWPLPAHLRGQPQSAESQQTSEAEPSQRGKGRQQT